MSKTAYLIVNFGGPRTLKEVEPFLRSLLCDKEVIRTSFPQPLHSLLFKRIAKKRAKIVAEDYAKIGGGSPIWSDTEYLRDCLQQKLHTPIFTFHRYLPATHPAFISQWNQAKYEEVRVFPCFPQFTYATTGSIAKFFGSYLPQTVLNAFRWVKSYPTHPAFVQAMQRSMRDFLEKTGLKEEKVCFLFSAHGLPLTFVQTGDPYQYECELSFQAVMQAFPKAHGVLCYQSKFGPGEWLRPYTVEVCENIDDYRQGREHIVFVPLSFTSDHIETLFEVEEQYMTIIKAKGLYPFRVPALNRRPDWIEAIIEILQDYSPSSNSMLIR